jgi:L-lactate dehydrogenase
VPQVVRHNPDGLLLIATNPVDVLTHAAWKLSGLPAQRVLGSGTILDTARFRYLLSQHYGVDPRSTHAFIVGEHGDNEVPVWSLANVAGMRLLDSSAAHGMEPRQEDLDTLFQETRGAAYQIIERKGATYYAVAAGLVRIVEAILRDQHTVLSVSNLIEDYYDIRDVCLSLPTVVGRKGVERVLRLRLSPEEVTGLRRSAEILKAVIAELKLA